jgi:hypothetical protein
MAENQKRGCWGTIGAIVGFSILAIAIARSCFDQSDSSDQKAQVNTNHPTENPNLSMGELRIFENEEFRVGYPDSWVEMPSDIQTKFQSMLSERVKLCFAAWSLDRTMVIQVTRYSLSLLRASGIAVAYSQPSIQLRR